MIYALFKNDSLVYVTTKSPWTGTPVMAVIHDDEGNVVDYDKVMDENDYKSFEEVEALATAATEIMGKQWIAFDNGEWTSRQFGIIQPPQVGDEASRAFNGDYYPVGKIVRITKNWMIVTEDADGHQTKFNRKKNHSKWTQVGGTWSLVKGVHDRLNPEF